MTQHCGYVALIGAPNAGKSTLLNALVGSDISIVTAKPQTTRGRVRGVLNEGNTQFIFVDTPGIFEATPKFEKAMVTAAWNGADEADSVLLVVDANRGVDNDTHRIITSIKEKKKPAILVLNKVDKLPDKRVLPDIAQVLYGLYDFERSFMISAERDEGVKDILKYLATRMPESPWLYPEDEMTDLPERMIAAEITREQAFERVHAEVPYSLMVATEKWEEKVDKSGRTIRINQVIMVERESHKKIVLGKHGAMLKAIGSSARHKIGKALGATVHLFLFVKVHETWKDDPESYKAAGLEYKN